MRIKSISLWKPSVFRPVIMKRAESSTRFIHVTLLLLDCNDL